MIEFGRQTPRVGYQRTELPCGEGNIFLLNLGLLGLTWFDSSLSELLDRWRRGVRREAWQAVTGGAPALPNEERCDDQN